MNTGRPNHSPNLLERYELKFVIPDDMIEPISDFCSIYCRPDKYSEKSQGGFYTVNSLYFDTPHYLFLSKRIVGSENRFNMRVRTYGDRAVPCFLEIKQKRVDIVRKYRARVDDDGWYQMFEIPGYAPNRGENTIDTSNMNLFYRLAHTHNAGPVVLTQYRRRAYVSQVDDYARVTIDKDLKYQPAEGYKLIPDGEQATNYDNSTVFDPECNVIVEMKCDSVRVPYWMIDMIRNFNLQRRSFSKYVFSITEILNQYHYDTSYRQATIKHV